MDFNQKVHQNNFKRTNKYPACTKAPWEHLIPSKERASIMLQIKQESIDIYGHDFNECVKRKVCFSKECQGRPLPWKSKTALPYLEEMSKHANIKNDELFLETSCTNCDIKMWCSAPCNQVSDYIERFKTIDQVALEKATQIDLVRHRERSHESLEVVFNKLDIPWDCINSRKQRVVKLYLYSQKDFLHIAKELGLYNQAASKYEFYSALTRLSKFANIRLWIKENLTDFDEDTQKILHDAFYENKTYAKIAKERKVTPQAVQQKINRLLVRYKVKWPVFVKRKNGKLMYFVPSIFK